jgi:fucose 4-O-acetylase-like acetyltransferase
MADKNIDDAIFHIGLVKIVRFIYTFHMPAFFALSGCLFKSQLLRHRYGNVKELIKNKFSRLICPMLFSYFVVCVPCLLISNYYDSGLYGKWGIIFQLFFVSSNYIWYVEALFFDFVFIYIICRKIDNKFLQWVIVIFIYLFGLKVWAVKFAALLPLGNPFMYIIWVWLGGYIEPTIMALKRMVKENKFRIMIEFWTAIVFFVLAHCFVKHGTWIMNDIYVFSLIIFLFDATNAVKNKVGTKMENIISKFTEYSYGIYLYSGIVNVPIFYWFARIFGVECLGNNAGAFVLWFIRLVFTTAFAIIMVKILKKFKIKAY